MRGGPGPRWRGGLILAGGMVGILCFPANFIWRLMRPLVHKDTVDRYAKAAGFDPAFVLALIRVESGFLRSARSHRGAMGLMQIMPETAREMAQRLGLDSRALVLENPETNIRLGVKYLEVLREEFGQDPVALLAAYNAGPSNVRVWRRGERLSIGEIPFPETKRFVRRVLSTERWIQRLKRLKRCFYV